MVGINDMDKPADEKEEKGTSVSPNKPLIIEPDDEVKPEEVKPVMPKLKGDAGKKLDKARKLKTSSFPEQSILVTLALFLCFVLLAGGTTFLVLPIFGIPTPGWLKPVMNICGKIPIFPAEKGTEDVSDSIAPSETETEQPESAGEESDEEESAKIESVKEKPAVPE